MIGWSVRRGGADDVHAVLRLEREIVEAPHWSREVYAGIVEQAGELGGVRRCLFVADSAGDVMGYAVGAIREDEGELESVAVAPPARGRGVGRELCAAVLAWCRERGAERVQLEVRAGSRGAAELYGRLGFVTTGRRRGYYAEPVEDALLMELDLRGADM